MQNNNNDYSGYKKSMELLDMSKTIIVERRKYLGSQKDYVFNRDTALLYTVLQDNSLIRDKKTNKIMPICIDSDIHLKDYKKISLFKSTDNVSVFGVCHDLFEVHVPIRVRLADMLYVDGRVTVIFRCDLDKPDKLLLFFNREGVKNEKTYSESRDFVTADALTPLVSSCVSDLNNLDLEKESGTAGRLEQIWNNIIDTIRNNLEFVNRGLIVSGVRARYDESKLEAALAQTNLNMGLNEQKLRMRLQSLTNASIEYDKINELS